MSKNLKEVIEKIEEDKKKEWYSLRHLLGYANWAMFYVILGGRPEKQVNLIA